MKPYNANIEKETIGNDDYRRVLWTGTKMQLVVMNLKVGEDIPMEVHPDIDQFIRVEDGEASIEIEGETYKLNDDDVIIIPAGMKHQVRNVGDSELKIYSIYATPEHADGTIHRTKIEADAAHAEEHGHSHTHEQSDSEEEKSE